MPCERAVRVSCAGWGQRTGREALSNCSPSGTEDRRNTSSAARRRTHDRKTKFFVSIRALFLQSIPNPFLIRCDGVSRCSSRTFRRTEGVQATNIVVFLPQTRESAANPESACAHPASKTPNRSRKLRADGPLRLQEPLAYFACFCSLCYVRNTAATMLESTTCAYAKGHQSVSADRAKIRPKRAPNATQRAKSSSSGGFAR